MGTSISISLLFFSLKRLISGGGLAKATRSALFLLIIFFASEIFFTLPATLTSIELFNFIFLAIFTLNFEFTFKFVKVFIPPLETQT